MQHTLYSFRRCPYAIRARMAVWQAGVPVELCEVSLRAKPAEMLAISPKGTVPVLRCADGVVIDESLAIMRWALAQRDPMGWLSVVESPLSQDLIQTNDSTFKHDLDRYKYYERYPEHSQAYYRDSAIDGLLGRVESILAHTPYLHGDQATLTDVALFPFVRQFAAVDRVWFENSPLVNTRQWLNVWLSDELFLTVMQK